MPNVATVYRIAGRTEEAQVYVQRVLQISAQHGDQEFWDDTIRKMYRDWDAKHARLYLDAPLTQNIPSAS